MLCPACAPYDYCPQIKASLVTDAELSNPEFIRDLRAYAFAQEVPAERWRDHLNDLYRDYRGVIVDAAGVEVFVETEHFEIPYFREWCRNFCCTPCPDHITPYVRREAWERVRTLATILRATVPKIAQFWGLRGLAANDNRKPE